MGTCVGLYLVGLYLPASQPLLGALFLLTFNLVAALLVYLHWPTPTSQAITSLCYALFVASLAGTGRPAGAAAPPLCSDASCPTSHVRRGRRGVPVDAEATRPRPPAHVQVPRQPAG